MNISDYIVDSGNPNDPAGTSIERAHLLDDSTLILTAPDAWYRFKGKASFKVTYNRANGWNFSETVNVKEGETVTITNIDGTTSVKVFSPFPIVPILTAIGIVWGITYFLKRKHKKS